ncbi:MAG: TonB-dependent receptor [Gammaproteobacteria bacterium]|uniref:TonB-dependent receptor n=1 Tax=SAR86 cluster bacterium TaxID=2030880 RepID=A0A520N037_9GAMM|nr:TonB-dependent receptor [SAR86 cluster bacterium]RZO26844.1 MAG: TonB-dependent receptor [SAR86 cluster bacterium]|tara:strand:+ start:10844 stop:13603 length:2760 start_codon:yes stop_codon:yes gene_type:complete
MKIVEKLVHALMLLALALPFYAQESDDEEEGIEVVITTAAKTEKDILNTSQAVSALSGDEIVQLGLTSIKDLNNMVPGLYVQGAVGPAGEHNSPVITLRGVRTSNVTELGDPAVGTHVDGIYVTRGQAANALMFDVERVELSRGPQGTLFGANSVVGTLNIVTAKPNFDIQGGSLTLNSGRYNEAGVQAHYNLPISDNLALRFSYSQQNKDSYLTGYYSGSQLDWRALPQNIRDQFTTISDQSEKTFLDDYAWYLGCQVWQDGCWADPGWQFSAPYNEVLADPKDFYNNVDNMAWRVSATYKFDDDVSTLNFQYEQFQDNGAGSVGAPACELMRNRTGTLVGDPAVYTKNTCTDILGSENRYQAYVNVPGEANLDIESFRAIFKSKLGDLDLTINYGYQGLQQASQYDIDQGYNYAYGMSFNWNDLDVTTNVLDAFVTGTTDNLAYVVGAFVFNEDMYALANFHADLQGTTYFWQPKRVKDHFALYGQGTYQLNDDLFFTFGGRFNYDERSDTGGRNLDCSQWVGCHPTTELWGNRFAAYPNINSYDFDFWVDYGKQVDGVDCVAPAIGCATVQTENDVTESWENFSWRIGLDWDMSDQAFMYTYLATAYKTGSLGDVYVRPSNSTGTAGERVSLAYDPEYVTTFEWGVKGKNEANTLNASFNLFFTEYDGKQFTGNLPVDTVLTPVYVGNPNDPNFGQTILEEQGVTIWTTENFGVQEIFGAEFEYTWLPYDGGRVSGFVTSYHSEITEDFVTMWRYGQDYLFARDYAASIDANNPNNFVNLRGNEAPYTPRLSLSIRGEHTYRFGNGMELKPGFNYRWEDSSYTSIWNADKHINDEGGFDGPGYFAQPIETFSDRRPAWEMWDYFLTLDSKQGWYLQGYSYNANSEIVPYALWIEAGFPRGSYSAPAQKGIRFGYYW